MNRLRQRSPSERELVETSADAWRARAVNSIVAASRSGVELPASIARLDADRLLPLVYEALLTMDRRASRLHRFRRRAFRFWGTISLLAGVACAGSAWQSPPQLAILIISFLILVVSLFGLVVSLVAAPIENRFDDAVRRLIGVARCASRETAGPILLAAMTLPLPADTARTIPTDAAPWLERLDNTRVAALPPEQIRALAQFAISDANQRWHTRPTVAAWLVLATRASNDPILASNRRLLRRATRASKNKDIPEIVRAAADEFLRAVEVLPVGAGARS